MIQSGMLFRPNQVSSDVPKRRNWLSVTLGHGLASAGGSSEYGCSAQASKRSRGRARARSSAKRTGFVLPCADVSPIATSAFGLPLLIPAYAAR